MQVTDDCLNDCPNDYSGVTALDLKIALASVRTPPKGVIPIGPEYLYFEPVGNMIFGVIDQWCISGNFRELNTFLFFFPLDRYNYVIGHSIATAAYSARGELDCWEGFIIDLSRVVKDQQPERAEHLMKRFIV